VLNPGSGGADHATGRIQVGGVSEATMARRRSVPMAGALAVAACSAAVALGANFGLFGLTQGDSRVGRLPTEHQRQAAEPAVTAEPVAQVAGYPVTRPAADGRLDDD
jgi:hypothetical protein